LIIDGMLPIQNSIIKIPERSDIHKFSFGNNQSKVGPGKNTLKREEDTMAKKKEKKGKKGKKDTAKKKAKKGKKKK
jgi:hypothetical protein